MRLIYIKILSRIKCSKNNKYNQNRNEKKRLSFDIYCAL